MSSPLDQEVFNTLEKPSSSDWNRVGDAASYALREVVNSLLLRRLGASSGGGYTASHNDYGFLADGFFAEAGVINLSVSLRAGIGFYRDAADVPTNITAGPAGVSGVDDLSELKPLILTADKTVSLAGIPDPTNPRWVLVEARYDRRLGDYQSKFLLNPTTGVFTPNSVPKALTWELDSAVVMADASTAINLVIGTAAATPTRPNPTTGYMPIAYVYLPANATAVDSIAYVLDCRKMLMPSGIISIGGMVSCDGSNGFDEFYAALPPGWRYTAERGNQGDGNDHETTIWLFHPPYTVANFAPCASSLRRISAVAALDNNDSVVVQGGGGQLVTAAVKAGVAGGWNVSEAIDVCVGQPVTQIVVTTAGSVGVRVVNWSATIPTHL